MIQIQLSAKTKNDDLSNEGKGGERDINVRDTWTSNLLHTPQPEAGANLQPNYGSLTQNQNQIRDTSVHELTLTTWLHLPGLKDIL